VPGREDEPVAVRRGFAGCVASPRRRARTRAAREPSPCREWPAFACCTMSIDSVLMCRWKAVRSRVRQALLRVSLPARVTAMPGCCAGSDVFLEGRLSSSSRRLAGRRAPIAFCGGRRISASRSPLEETRRAQGRHPAGASPGIAVTLGGKKPEERLANTEIEQLSIDTIGRCRWTWCAGKRGAIPARRWLSRARVRALRRGDATQPGEPPLVEPRPVLLSAGHACVLQYSALHLTGYNSHSRS